MLLSIVQNTLTQMIALVLCEAWIFVTKQMGGVNFWLQSISGDENCGQKTLIFKRLNDPQALGRALAPLGTLQYRSIRGTKSLKSCITVFNYYLVLSPSHFSAFQIQDYKKMCP